MRTSLLPTIGILAWLAISSAANANTKASPTPLPSASPSVAAADLRELGKILTPELCKNGLEDPLQPLRAEISKFRKQYVSTEAMKTRLKALLEQEQKEGTDLAELNWIRAVNPWLLPSDFPGRPALTKCASELRNFSDTRLDVAIDEWKSCLDIAYPAEKPPEFAAIQKCLAATAHLLPSNR